MKLTLLYSDGLEAVYFDDELVLVDEIIDLENLINSLVNKHIMSYTSNRIKEDVFEYKYNHEFPKSLSKIDQWDYVKIYN